MTIVHLVIGGDVAGGQLVALRLIRAVRARGDRAVVVAPARGEFVELLEREGVPVRLVDLRRTFRAREAWRLRRILREVGADVLHTHTQLAPNILGRIAARLAGVPVISHMHIENHFRPQRALAAVHRALDNATARLCARIIVVSEATRLALARQGYPVELMEVVHNGIEPPDDAGPPAGIRAQLGLPANAPLVGAVGRLCAVKGQRELIEATALLGADVRLVLVGKDLERGGVYEETLRREAERLGVGDRVAFAGYRDDVPALLRELDVFALPSWIEGLPLVVLEAMAAGLPVVATPVGGTPELVVDGETGLLVPPRDVPALRAAIVSLLGDPERARAMGAAGRARARKHFSAAEAGRRVLAIYDEVAGRSATTRSS